MADFKQAVKWMDEGLKIHRIDGWRNDKEVYLFDGCDGAIMEYNPCIELEGHIDKPGLTTNDYGAEDWEIYEEEETLSDKRAGTHLHDYFLDDGEHGCNASVMTHFYHEEDVKEFIKELLETEYTFEVINRKIYVTKDSHDKFFEKLKKLAGDKLV